jgi:DNA-binding NtrC family response regulator
MQKELPSTLAPATESVPNVEPVIPHGRVLIVDDDQGFSLGLCHSLQQQGYETAVAATYQDGESCFAQFKPQITLLNYALAGGNAKELLPRLKTLRPRSLIVIIASQGSINLAVEMMRRGADDFVTKSGEQGQLLSKIAQLLQQRATEDRYQRGDDQPLYPFAGVSPAIHRLRDEVEKMLVTDKPILILGETGSGKGTIARWIHFQRFPDKPFVSLNCAGLTPEFLETELFGHSKGAYTGAVSAKTGLFQVAHNGTLFLDEIGDMDFRVQAKLLTVMEDKRFRRLGDVREYAVDVRLIAATNKDLAMLVQQGNFRRDLYFRVNTLPLMVPPLRERPEDIPLLTEQLLGRIVAELGRFPVSLTVAAKKALRQYEWPGNIRELQNVLERTVIISSSEIIDATDLRFDRITGIDYPKVTEQMLAPAAATGLNVRLDELTLEQMEQFHIENVLRLTKGHVGRAAQILGVPRSTLYTKVKRFAIKIPKE